MPKFDTIREALQALPVGVPAIAAHLADLGIKATCLEPRRCALAEYLTQSLDIPDGMLVSVGQWRAQLVTASRGTVVQTIAYTTSCYGPDFGLARGDISQFVRCFDLGLFPALIAERRVQEVGA